MKIKTGKYLYLGNRDLFEFETKYSNTITGIKLTDLEKKEVSNGAASLYTVRNDKIVRINLNGTVRKH